MTKTLLVPTDFSENAYYAAQYACKLASQRNYKIELLHCYTTTSTAFEKEDESPILKADILMAEWQQKLSVEFSTIVLKTTCVTGLIVELIPTLTQEGEYALIVMGTTGAGKNKSILWGSTTSHIASNSTIPVLAIPNKYDRFKFDHVAMLTNFKHEELETLTNYILHVHTVPHLDLIHVCKDIDKLKQTEQILESWSYNIKEINGIEKVDAVIRPIENHDPNLDTVPEVIHAVIVENNYDMILVTKTRKTFFERLFEKSISKQIVLNLDRPTFFDNN